jgi:hypothetical protein
MEIETSEEVEMPSTRMLTLMLAVLLIVAIFGLAGCDTDQQTSDQPPETTPTPEPPEETEDTEGLELEIVSEWLESGHANIQVFPAGRDECVRCHDGGAFAEGITMPADLEREFMVAIDCRACHTGRGPELAEGGTVDLPDNDGVSAGAGALCMECHNARRAPDPTSEERSAPHYSAQAEIVTGSGAMPIDGVEYDTTDRHASVTDTCVGCHVGSHTFAASYETCEAAECHALGIDADATAEADYDGDGTVATFTEEIQGMLDMLEEAIGEATNGGSFTVEGGAINFVNQADEPLSVEDRVYAAAYNHVLVSNDGSLGVHNPGFVVSLLRESYTLVSGNDHPGAELVEQE